MPGFLDELTSYYHQTLERHRNLPFLKACMAACALIATIEGEVSLSQRLRIDKILETLEALQVFDPHEGVDLFNAYAGAIFEGPEAGRREALRFILQVAQADPEKADLLVRICLAVSDADGSVSLVEQIEIVTLCSILGLSPERYGLYSDADVQGVLAAIDLDGA